MCKQFLLISILFILSLLDVDGVYCATSMITTQSGQDAFIVYAILPNYLKHKTIIVLKNDTSYYPVIVSDTSVCDTSQFKKIKEGDTLKGNLEILEVSRPDISEVIFLSEEQNSTKIIWQNKTKRIRAFTIESTILFYFWESDGDIYGTFYTSSRFCGQYFIVR